MKLTAQEKIYAEGAALVARMPHRLVLTDPVYERYHQIDRLDFHVARSTVDEVTLTRFEGVPGASRRRLSGPIGMLAVDFARLTNLHCNGSPDAELGFAVNFKALGRAVLCAAIPGEHMPDIDDPFVVGVAVGDEDMNAGLVAVMPDRSLITLSVDQTPAAVGLAFTENQYNSIESAPQDLRIY